MLLLTVLSLTCGGKYVQIKNRLSQKNKTKNTFGWLISIRLRTEKEGTAVVVHHLEILPYTISGTGKKEREKKKNRKEKVITIFVQNHFSGDGVALD